MKYEIAYLSTSGNTEKLAHGIADYLPVSETFVTDLRVEDVTGQAEIYIIGFGMKNEAIPIDVMNVLEELEGKTIMFFVTASVEPTDEMVASIERKLDPFLPMDCDYRGLYLCRGQVSDSTIEKLEGILQEQPDNEKVQFALDMCKKTKGHPNNEDISAAYRFIKENLE